MYIYIYIYLYLYLFIYLSIYLSIYLYISLSLYIYIYIDLGFGGWFKPFWASGLAETSIAVRTWGWNRLRRLDRPFGASARGVVL